MVHGNGEVPQAHVDGARAAGAHGSHPLGPASNPWFDRWAGSLFNLNTGTGTDYNEWEKTFATSIDPSMDECTPSLGMPCRVLLDPTSTIAPPPAQYATVDTVDDAVHLIGTLPEPWFLYVAFNAPHIPFTPPTAPLGPSACQGFDRTCSITDGTKAEETRCMVQWMDNELGRLICDVDLEGLSDRTVILFIGDNGTVGNQTNQGITVPGAILPPFNGNHGKSTLYQGGVNVPLIARGPGIDPGICHELVSSTDLLATVAEIAGLPSPNQLAEDSVSIVPYLFGKNPGDPVHMPVRKTVYVERFNPNFVPVAGGRPVNYQPKNHERAIRNANYKLIRRESARLGGPVRVVEEFYDLRRPMTGLPQTDPYEDGDLRPFITPGGSSPQDSAYDSLLAEMQADHPSLFDMPVPATRAGARNPSGSSAHAAGPRRFNAD